MAYETLIAALLQEGEARSKAILSKARADADRLVAEAEAAAEASDREAELQAREEVTRQRTAILGRASIAARRNLLEAKREVLEAVWRRVTEKTMALQAHERTKIMEALLDELLAEAPPGPLQAVIDGRERAYVEDRLRDRNIPFHVQNRDDLLLGLELEGDGEVLRNSLATRLAKARPELVIELNRLLFPEQQASGERQGVRGAADKDG
jgi:vacuolar-type H+-ATPase subunit E/Vma4